MRYNTRDAAARKRKPPTKMASFPSGKHRLALGRAVLPYALMDDGTFARFLAGVSCSKTTVLERDDNAAAGCDQRPGPAAVLLTHAETKRGTKITYARRSQYVGAVIKDGGSASLVARKPQAGEAVVVAICLLAFVLFVVASVVWGPF